MGRRFYSSRRRARLAPPGLGAAAALLVVAAAMPASAQSGLEAVCAAAGGPEEAECRMAVATVRSIQERVGTALWGGSPVPGTASTLGMRLGSTPRVSVSARVSAVPMAVPPLLDREADRSRRATVFGVSAQTAVGVLPGWSPLPTVGGVLSLDAIGQLSVARLPGGHGFGDGAALGWSAGLRVGALRESFTMPGVSLTATYGSSSTVTLGDPAMATTDGFVRGSVSDLGATLAASQRVGGVRLTGGVAADRYTTRARVGYGSPDGGVFVLERGRVTTHRRSWFVNASWTRLVFHTTAEAGWQSIPAPTGLPPGVRVDPVGWWLGAAFRVSI
jgi:hypothetical protein